MHISQLVSCACGMVASTWCWVIEAVRAEANQGSLSRSQPAQDSAFAHQVGAFCWIAVRRFCGFRASIPPKGSAQLVKGEQTSIAWNGFRIFQLQTSGPDLVVVLHRKGRCELPHHAHQLSRLTKVIYVCFSPEEPARPDVSIPERRNLGRVQISNNLVPAISMPRLFCPHCNK